MSADDTAKVIEAYFTAMGSGHFQQFLTDDVTWTTIQSGEELQGADAVEAGIKGLHARMTDMKTRQLSVADGTAYIEGTCAGQDGRSRIPYCVAYDLAGERIAAMRAYGDIAVFMPLPG
jgi:hypothetical protein